jgi:hypothetical protein
MTLRTAVADLEFVAYPDDAWYQRRRFPCG